MSDIVEHGWEIVRRTERGWPGHFICAHLCIFHRNTLLEYGEARIVVSTVGMMRDPLKEGSFQEIGLNRYYETMAFHAKKCILDKYWDADVTREVNFQSPWYVEELGADDKANDMHENVVFEIINGLWEGRYRAEDNIIDDGFGNMWSKTCPECGKESMEIVRPGKVQCAYCG